MSVAYLHQTHASTDKGKHKAISIRDEEGNGGSSGIVLPLQMIMSSAYQSQYTISLLVGGGQQNLSLQVDTGSSDLWIASQSCSTSSCGQTGGHLYNPSTSQPTQQQFSIQYAAGQVSGPIVWDTVMLGGYNISAQALAAASTVTNEPLAPEFDGILGLALPLNSIISQKIPPSFSNAPDGAVFASNLFSLTPAGSTPAARFISLALERPGSDKVPSVLGLGRHPAGLVPDPSAIHYSEIYQDAQGALFWKTSVLAITVYDNGQPKEVQLTSSSSSTTPSAILDSGTPVILTTTAIANGIYGAIGVSPASNGQYYLPCTTPINMTIQLDDRPDLPLHPLDLTFPTSGSTCIGIIQTFASIGQSDSSIDADIVLGVPFLRNTYTVMAYEAPDVDGSFAPPSTTGGPTGTLASPDIDPRLGLMNLTDPTVAMEEFIQVRVNNQPLSSSAPSAQPYVNSSSSSGSKHHLPVGVDVLLALVGFFALCFALFGVRWIYMRRRWRKKPSVAFLGSDIKDQDAYALEALAHRLSTKTDMPTAYSAASASSQEDTLRTVRYGDAKSHEDCAAYSDHELGFRARKHASAKDGSASPLMLPDSPEFGDETLVNLRAPSPTLARTPSPTCSHHRLRSSEPGVTAPLLVHAQNSSYTGRRSDEAAESDFKSGGEWDSEGDVDSATMAGIGTARRSTYSRRFSQASASVRRESRPPNPRQSSSFMSDREIIAESPGVQGSP